MHMNEYPGWEEIFHTYVLGQNTELWLSFTTEFDQALEEAGSNAATFAALSVDDKKAYDLEKKAFSILTQVLNKYIYHQFMRFKTTKSLWDALKARGHGNASSRKLRNDLLKKELDGFMCMERESLADLTSRYYHLLSEMGNFGVVHYVKRGLWPRFWQNCPATHLKKCVAKGHSSHFKTPLATYFIINVTIYTSSEPLATLLENY
ncbi:hypothetical protein HanRHA438_Chr04g0162101 [Helianthus annuus]|nr:hypothetical protein HanRHA438_Chr04g0162101 [Helianthus annuus]